VTEIGGKGALLNSSSVKLLVEKIESVIKGDAGTVLAVQYHLVKNCKCLICSQSIHEWKGCTCTKCGSTRNEDHTWYGCKCIQCGEIRDMSHDWGGCKCKRCGTTRDMEHKWNRCKCSVCNAVRDEGHVWKTSYNNDDGFDYPRPMGEYCSICGTTREA
jgi:hypothetical protein